MSKFKYESTILMKISQDKAEKEKNKFGFYVSSWDGKKSRRYNRGGLWLGFNKVTRNVFIIYNGKIDFGIQTWRPYFWFCKR